MKQVRIRIIDTYTNTTVQDFSSTDVFETEENLAARSSIVLNYEGSDDKYGVLMTSSLTFDLLVPDAMDGKFYHLFTGSESQFRVDLTDEHENLLWRGWLLPDQYSEPYKNGCFFVSMTATDRVGLLKGLDFESYEMYSKEHSVITYLTTALRATGLVQDLYFSPAIEAVNGYRWDETYIDGYLYADDKKESDVEVVLMPETDNIYDVLERLVHDLGCKLYSWRGKWYLVGMNQQHKTEIDFVVYSADGAYKGVEKVQVPTKDLTFYSEPTITVVSPWKKVSLSAAFDEESDVIDESFYEQGETVFDLPVKDKWNIVGNAEVVFVPRDGKWIYTWTKPGQTIPDVTISTPTNLAVRGNVTESNVKGSYIEFKQPIYLEKPYALFQFKYFNFEIELISYTRGNGIKERFEKNEFGDLMRYEVLYGNEVLYSNFPDSNRYKDSAFDIRHSSDSVELKDDVYHNKNFVETRQSIKGKFKKQKYSIVKSDWLQVRIYPPVHLNPNDKPFDAVGIDKLSLKILAKKDYKVNVVRPIDYTTKKTVELFHIDNSQDNTKKRFLFRRTGVEEQKSWRLSWRRVGVNENKRYGDCFARMVHCVQPKPHIKIDGDVIGISEPNYLFGFSWMGKKNFIPVRLEMNFSEAKTSITMIENVYENVV
ncbi:MAG: hypothetical protein LBE34_13925 [Flavobacteriaceae bacterium]|jgi:hypothetical protein|nr:hypothetical protein [Flavobacteriaceae bacterium]